MTPIKITMIEKIELEKHQQEHKSCQCKSEYLTISIFRRINQQFNRIACQGTCWPGSVTLCRFHAVIPLTDSTPSVTVMALSGILSLASCTYGEICVGVSTVMCTSKCGDRCV